jgi:hypothetical protein
MIARGRRERRLEAALMPDDVIIMLNLDRRARQERDQRRRGGVGRSHDLARLR